MIETYKSKVPFPIEVSEVSSETVRILNEEKYFEEQFEYPEQAKTLYYERLASSLIIKFIDGCELIWCDQEFQDLIVKSYIEQLVNEMEFNKIVNVFEDESGEKIVVLRKDKMNLVF